MAFLRAALFVGVLVALLAAGSAGARTDATQQAKGRVVIAEFGGAYSKSIRDTLVNPFSKATGYQGVVVDTTDRVQKPLAMVKANRVQWDLIEVLDTEAAELQARGALQPITPGVRSQLQKVLNPGTVTRFGVAISSYSNVITCNKKSVSKCPVNAKQFWDTKSFPGERTVDKSNWFDNMIMALIADGVPKNKLFPLDIPRALQKWRSLKDEISVYFTSGDQWQQLLRDGEVDMGLGPDGRTWNLVNEGLDLSISYQGMPYRVDYFVALRKSANPAGAMEFLRWYGTNPRAQAKFMKQRLYGMPHPQAYKFVDRKTAKQLVDYPPNRRQTVTTDISWVYKNGARASKAWSDFLAG